DIRPTSGQGLANVDYDELNTRRLESALTSLVENNTPLTEGDPTVEISIVSDAELQKRLQAINDWNLWSRPAWVLKWPANACLAPVRPKSVNLEGPLTHVDLAVR